MPNDYSIEENKLNQDFSSVDPRQKKNGLFCSLWQNALLLLSRQYSSGASQSYATDHTYCVGEDIVIKGNYGRSRQLGRQIQRLYGKQVLYNLDNLDIFVNWKFTILGRRINSSNLRNVESFVRKRAIIVIIIIFCFPQRFVNKALKHLQTMLMHINQKLTHKTRVRFLYALYLSEYCIYSLIVFLLYLQSE